MKLFGFCYPYVAMEISKELFYTYCLFPLSCTYAFMEHLCDTCHYCVPKKYHWQL